MCIRDRLIVNGFIALFVGEKQKFKLYAGIFGLVFGFFFVIIGYYNIDPKILGLITVSYTHLDVYKRQIPSIPAQVAFLYALRESRAITPAAIMDIPTIYSKKAVKNANNAELNIRPMPTIRTIIPNITFKMPAVLLISI